SSALILVVHRIHPSFNGERLGVRSVQGRVKRDFSAGREIEELSTIRVAYDCARERMHHSTKGSQIVGGISGGAQAAAVFVDKVSGRVIVESMIGHRVVAEDGGWIIGARQLVHQQR